MALIAAPARQFKTWSFWLDVALFSVGPITELIRGFSEGDSPLIAPRIVAAVVSTLAALSLIARFVKQSIEMTTEQKVDVIESAGDQPVKKGEADVEAKVVNLAPPAAGMAIKQWVETTIKDRDARYEQRFAALEALVLQNPAGTVAAPAVPPVPAA